MSKYFVKWEDPPAGKGDGPPWMGIVAGLVEQPNRWALIRDDLSPQRAYQVAAEIRDNRHIPVRGGRFEARARTIDRTGRVYVRFVPDAIGPSNAP